MQFSQLFTFSLIGLAAAAPSNSVKRDLATFQTAFNSVSSALTTFDSSVVALTPSSDIPTAVSTLNTQGDAIVSALSTGATNINATASLSLIDSLNLLSLSNTLVSTSNTTVNDLISKKDIITGAGQTSLVLTQLGNVKAATYGFIGAVASHVPSSVTSIVNNQAGQVITILNNGITAYGGST